MQLIIFILSMFLIGAVTGMLARNSRLMRGRGFGLEGSIIAGLFGSVAGGLANMGGITKIVLGFKIGGLLGLFIWSTMGAIVVLFVIGLVKKDKKYD